LASPAPATALRGIAVVVTVVGLAPFLPVRLPVLEVPVVGVTAEDLRLFHLQEV
jgi:hypothetical protein